MIEIDTTNVKNYFNEFIKINGNSRIFFSGKFGTGKTTFLNNFFELNKNDYEVFHLYPVNYQISTNEDILELIKYDLLVELIKKDGDILQKEGVNGIKDSSLLFYSWAKNKLSINSVLKSILDVTSVVSELPIDPTLGLLGKLGRPLKDLLDIDKEFQEFKKDYVSGEKGKAEKYLEAIRSKNISEVDYISHLLKEKIFSIKKDKKSVLIIDDLDRIDPEHIFRILNVLSAYFEKDGKDIFGFDKIIIVADIENISKIFAHKYGVSVDFKGYIDKFFSLEIYDFDNRNEIIRTIDKIIANIEIQELELKNSFSFIFELLKYFFTISLKNNSIDLRQLLKHTNFLYRDYKKGNYKNTHSANKDLIKIFNIFIRTIITNYGHKDLFIKSLEEGFTGNNKYDYTFSKFIVVMLNELNIINGQKIDGTVVWDNYHIENSNNVTIPLNVRGGSIESLFINLLISYIKNNKHKIEEINIIK